MSSKQQQQIKSMNLSNVDLIEKSLSRTNLAGNADEEDCGSFAWIDKVPNTLQYAINISQIYCKKPEETSSDDLKIVKIKIWLETAEVKLNIPVIKILQLKELDEGEGILVWQLNPFDELISLEIPICLLKDKEIELVFELETVEPSSKISGLKGRMRLFTDSGVLKSGLNPIGTSNQSGIEDIIKLERALYKRKSKEVPTWHIQLMKERLKELKRIFCSENPEVLIINVVVPIPSFPLKIKLDGKAYDKEITEDLCVRDVNESQEDSMIKRQNPEIFSNLSESTISNGDLRALRGILHRGFTDPSNVPADAANILWNHREFLARHYPFGIVVFVQSIQWWLSASDPTEIDEALRVIDTWKLPKEEADRMEIGVLLMVAMSDINGLSDSEVWERLFENLIPEKREFVRKYQSALIRFLTLSKMEGLKTYLKESVLFGEREDVNVVSEMYWRLKTSDHVGLFKEYCEGLSEEMHAEIRKQERLFESIEGVLQRAQRLKGSRTVKLEAIKKGLSDPDSGVPSAAQQMPLIPGLQDDSGGSKRVSAVVSDRSNLFKSTAFTVLIVFLRESLGALPLIFKRGDDLRRDAACLRVFRLIWDLWQEEGGMELFPRRLLYGVTPLSEEFGLVEFVESVPLSRIIVKTGGEGHEDGIETEWSINSYLKGLSDPSAPSNFLPSCVGFSLLTYLLGIGDRHLDNLLLTPSGQLLHIDFSFVFGADPKPFPPPIKMTREMVRGFEKDEEEEGSGGEEDSWHEFKGLCFTALSILRRRSSLILSTLRCEYPAEDYQCVAFVEERLSVLVSQAEALGKMDRLLEESRRAMFPLVMETIHKWVQYWKS